MTEKQEEELDEICRFYVKDKKFTEAFKEGITKFMSKYSIGQVKLSLEEVMTEAIEKIVDKKLNEP